MQLCTMNGMNGVLSVVTGGIADKTKLGRAARKNADKEHGYYEG
jgi:hypothetical protein